MLSRFSSLFIDRITKKRLIRSIPCKRKKFHFTAHTWVDWCATKRWEEWAKVNRCNVFSKQWGTKVLTAKFDTVGVFCIVQREHINNHVQTSALHLNILSTANSYPWNFSLKEKKKIHTSLLRPGEKKKKKNE